MIDTAQVTLYASLLSLVSVSFCWLEVAKLRKELKWLKNMLEWMVDREVNRCSPRP